MKECVKRKTWCSPFHIYHFSLCSRMPDDAYVNHSHYVHWLEMLFHPYLFHFLFLFSFFFSFFPLSCPSAYFSTAPYDRRKNRDSHEISNVRACMLKWNAFELNDITCLGKYVWIMAIIHIIFIASHAHQRFADQSYEVLRHEQPLVYFLLQIIFRRMK